MSSAAALAKPKHQLVSGLSGNEIFCLNRIGMRPGNLCIGNSVFSIGVGGGVTAGLSILAGGEITGITSMVHEGRANALLRMSNEAKQWHGSGIAGVSTEIVRHGGNIEFVTVGSTVHLDQESAHSFSCSADAQELYCQIDAGFQPLSYAFGNVAYSIGVGGGLGGALRSLTRGEVKEYTEVFDHTRHLALNRISNDAKRFGANAVVGIETTITPLMGAQEMVMVGTASKHPLLATYTDQPVTSDMTNQEMWNMANMGYLPLRLVMGVSVYSLGFVGGVASALKSLARGEVSNLTSLLYEAREKALDRVERDAERWKADQVVGVKTHVYDLGGGLVEFLAIGTAVKKMDGAGTKNPELPPQAILQDRETYFESAGQAFGTRPRSAASSRAVQGGPIAVISFLFIIMFYILMAFLRHRH